MPSKKRDRENLPPWLSLVEKLVAIIALLNLVLVLFDLSYVPGRDFYIRGDLFGERFRTTKREKYLAKVDRLQTLLQQNGLDDPQVEPLLAELRQQSIDLVDEKRFRVTDRYGALEEIKTRIETAMGAENAEQAFLAFWNREYLNAVGWRQAMDFFNRDIRFLMTFYEPQLFYDPVKGIEPYRDTQNYLQLVDSLTVELQRDGLQSDRIEPFLGQLRELSTAMINQNFFERAQKNGTLEEIKNNMRRHIYSRTEPRPQGPRLIMDVIELLAPEVLWADKSSSGAFRIFWSEENFQANGWEKEIAFFNEEIRLNMQSNYFRHYGIANEYMDRFWLIDIFFMAIFFVDLVFRIWLIVRRHPNMTLDGAILWRWYDLILLIPFWRWLRVIPVVIRLNEANLMNIEWVQKQARLGFVANFAKELTEVVVVQTINQMKGSVESGQISRSLLEPAEKEYIDINEINEVQAISNRLLEITVCRVLPEVQPDLQALLSHQMESTMKSSELYRRIQQLPGFGDLSHQMAEQLVKRVSRLVTEGPENAYEAIVHAPPDPVGEKLTQQLVEHFGSALRKELQREDTIGEFEYLISSLLEEIKINYVQQMEQSDPEDLFDETEALRKRATSNIKVPGKENRG
ncbi:hypothetical protein J0895_04980 [Phormidium pseudopriestleyi FRX01]|uniref:Ion transporter n=1 Tax=Phormidium pseudopriestleyi FRX01 TaxID=1759528 RepID=A0ABS3FMX6_9CYAN|nr:hypothetical protein [Phormidium pseudopriestleyi]MBO0348468.1 hypothetical protein [Phormidium pseudopriestleyi FRX01]